MTISSREQLQRMQYAIQKMRSITFENYEAWISSWQEPGDYSRATLETIAEAHEPLLFGQNCVLPDIVKCLDGEPTEIDVMNFTLLLKDSQLFKIASMSAYGVSQFTMGGIKL